MRKPVCAECANVEIELTVKKAWDEHLQTWVELEGDAIYDCPECGEVEIEWEGEN